MIVTSPTSGAQSERCKLESENISEGLAVLLLVDIWLKLDTNSTSGLMLKSCTTC